MEKESKGQVATIEVLSENFIEILNEVSHSDSFKHEIMYTAGNLVENIMSNLTIGVVGPVDIGNSCLLNRLIIPVNIARHLWGCVPLCCNSSPTRFPIRLSRESSFKILLSNGISTIDLTETSVAKYSISVSQEIIKIKTDNLLNKEDEQFLFDCLIMSYTLKNVMSLDKPSTDTCFNEYPIHHIELHHHHTSWLIDNIIFWDMPVFQSMVLYQDIVSEFDGFVCKSRCVISDDELQFILKGVGSSLQVNFPPILSIYEDKSNQLFDNKYFPNKLSLQRFLINDHILPNVKAWDKRVTLFKSIKSNLSYYNESYSPQPNESVVFTTQLLQTDQMLRKSVRGFVAKIRLTPLKKFLEYLTWITQCLLSCSHGSFQVLKSSLESFMIEDKFISLSNIPALSFPWLRRDLILNYKNNVLSEIQRLFSSHDVLFNIFRHSLLDDSSDTNSLFALDPEAVKNELMKYLTDYNLQVNGSLKNTIKCLDSLERIILIQSDVFKRKCDLLLHQLQLVVQTYISPNDVPISKQLFEDLSSYEDLLNDLNYANIVNSLLTSISFNHRSLISCYSRHVKKNPTNLITCKVRDNDFLFSIPVIGKDDLNPIVILIGSDDIVESKQLERFGTRGRYKFFFFCSSDQATKMCQMNYFSVEAESKFPERVIVCVDRVSPIVSRSLMYELEYNHFIRLNWNDKFETCNFLTGEFIAIKYCHGFSLLYLFVDNLFNQISSMLKSVAFDVSVHMNAIKTAISNNQPSTTYASQLALKNPTKFNNCYNLLQALHSNHTHITDTQIDSVLSVFPILNSKLHNTHPSVSKFQQLAQTWKQLGAVTLLPSSHIQQHNIPDFPDIVLINSMISSSIVYERMNESNLTQFTQISLYTYSCDGSTQMEFGENPHPQHPIKASPSEEEIQCIEQLLHLSKRSSVDQNSVNHPLKKKKLV